MHRAPTPACAFGPFQLDPSEHRLLRDGQLVPLTPKVFEVLCVLVRDHGRLVPKERLLEEVWPERFVDEANLNRAVSVLRKALGERAGEQRYIETVPKMGYRFVAPVTVYGTADPSGAVTGPAAPGTREAGVRVESKTRRRAAVISAVLAMGLLVYIVASWPAPDLASAGAALAPSHRQLTFTGHEGLPAISPNGKRLAYVSSSGATKRVLVQNVDGGQPVEIISGFGAMPLRWSPAGTKLLVWARTPEWEGIFVAAEPFTTPQRVSQGSFIACWSPDGATIAVAKYLSGRVTLFDVEGREQRAFTLQGDHFWISDADWSPAGDRLLITTNDQEGRFTIWTIRPDGQDQRIVLQDHAEIDTARWTPRADAIYYSLRANQAVTLLTLPMDAAVSRAGAAPATILSGLEMDRRFDLTADGRRLVYARARFHSNLWLVEVAGAGEDPPLRTRQLTHGTSLVERPRVSPDGTSIVFNMGRESLANLYSMPIEGGTPKPITSMDAFSIGGVWSADGRRIAFASTKDGVSRLWTVDAGGGAPRPISTEEISNSLDLAWHPSPHILAQRPGNQDYLEIDPESGRAQPLVKDSSVGWVFSPVHSPDRRRVAVTWNRRGGRGIWTIDRGNGRETFVYDSGKDFVMPIGWSADGSGIYAVAAQDAEIRGLLLPTGATMTEARILLIAANSGRAHVIARLPFAEVGSVSMAPDGQRFVCSVYSADSDVWIADLSGK